MGSSKRSIICLATMDWGSLFARRQQLMLRLARAGFPVHYRNPAQIRGIPPEEVAPRLLVYRDYDYLPEQKREDAIYFLYFPAYAAWMESVKEKFTIYDCTDDFPEFTKHEDLMLDCADLVICCSEPLRRKFAGRHDRILYLPNGVDIGLFTRVKEAIPPELNRIRQAGGVVVGFVGALCADWVDLELLDDIARARPEWQIVVVGETYRTPVDFFPPNVRFMGSHDYGAVPAFMRGLDIGLVPFLDNQIARGADPIKIYEYLAAGLPVVSRELPFIDGLGGPPLVYPYKDFPGCLTAIEQALAAGKGDKRARAQRLDYAKRNSWDERINDLLRELSKMTWLEGEG